MIAWLNPFALAGLVAVLVPVLIHLLRQHRAVRVVFPSLRFVHRSRSAAVRLRRISDPWLLLIRMAVIAAAACALAQPVVLTSARLENWNARVARAVVVDTSESMRLRGAVRAAADAADAEARASHVATRIETADLRGGVRQAVEWLASAPPARREVVIISDFQRGGLTGADITVVPSSIGVRGVQVAGAASPPSRLAGVDLFGRDARYDVELEGAKTTAAIVATKGTSAAGLRLIAGPGDEGAIDSLRGAVSAAGTPAPASSQPIAVVFAGGAAPPDIRALRSGWMVSTMRRLMSNRDLQAAGVDASAFDASTRAAPWVDVAWNEQGQPAVRAAAAGAELVISVAARPDAYAAAAAVRAVLTARHGRVAYPEHETLSADAQELAAWSRAPAPVGRELAVHADSTDGRWCWLIALVLLGVESLVRQRRAGHAVEEEAHAA